MNILFISDSNPNYVPDLLLHGLRKLMGDRVVDYPRKDCVYEGVIGLSICPDDQRLEGWFPSDMENQIDRDDIALKEAKGFFDLVVCDARVLSFATSTLKLSTPKMVIIDGWDIPHPMRPGSYVVCRRETDGSDFSIPLPMSMPEEVLSCITKFDYEPKKYSVGFLGSTHDGKRRAIIESLSTYFDHTLFAATSIPETNDPMPHGRMGRLEYYKHLQQCQVVISLPGAGLDTFRFWENAACNSVHASERMSLYIPNNFLDGTEIVRI